MRGELQTNASLARYTGWRVGGTARQLYKPVDREDVINFIRELPEAEPIAWLGLGSNCLIRDGGFPGTVIITQGALMGLERLPNDQVRAEAGVACAAMARFCARNNLTEGEFWCGIPGTVGGALAMNAGCFGGETWHQVVSVELLTREGEVVNLPASECNVDYRQVDLPQPGWFLSGLFQLKPGNKAQSLATIKEMLVRRRTTQPTGQHTCGSTFKNPPGDHAGRLIEASGLKNYKIGQVSVSDKHANFLISEDGATAQEIEDLIEHIQTVVLEKHGIALKTEIHILGEAL